jgi:hypothetical protein
MTKILLLGSAMAFAALAVSPAHAWDQYPFDEYSQRTETVTPWAGDSKDTNAAIHIIDPWPPYAGNRRIPGNGERMSGAVERYRDVGKLPRAPKPIVPLFDVQGGSTGSGGSGGGSGGAR